jgi:hypothetical protein
MLRSLLKPVLGCLFLFPLLSFSPPKSCTLTVSYKFENVVEGFDHECKTIVFVDGDQVAESSVKLESEPNSVTAVVPCGRHTVKIMNYALYEGEWEEHTIANEYSIDCSYETVMTLKKKTKIALVFDIDSGTLRTK